MKPRVSTKRRPRTLASVSSINRRSSPSWARSSRPTVRSAACSSSARRTSWAFTTIVGVSGVTKCPRLGSTETSPSDTSRVSACCTGLRETPKAAASSCRLSLSSGASLRVASQSFKVAYTWSFRSTRSIVAPGIVERDPLIGGDT